MTTSKFCFIFIVLSLIVTSTFAIKVSDLKLTHQRKSKNAWKNKSSQEIDFKKTIKPWKTSFNVKTDRILATLTVPQEPSQVFFRIFDDKNSEKDVFLQENVFVARPDEEGSDQYSVSMELKKLSLSERVPTNITAGMELIIGGGEVEEPLRWKLGSFKFPFKSSAQKEDMEPFKPLPEVDHLFQEPEPRAPVFISRSFTLAILIGPSLLFLIGLLLSGISIRRLFSVGFVGFVSNLAFQGCIALLLGILVLYWFHLSFFQTLGYLSGVGMVSLPVGYVALRSLVQNDVKSDHEHKAKKE
eukprot:gb/GECH01012838.1/.p1 GENE.gb/GECH01012838.1/~~gb/GECH01012838.1/.p1  ORF type:complete len:300 (+),score=78.97 gb/GECH01012838.1/:1-900(+)